MGLNTTAAAQHRAKFKAFRRLIKALRKNRKTNALKCKTKLVAKYPKMARELGVDKCNINTLLTDEKLREKLRKRINIARTLAQAVEHDVPPVVQADASPVPACLVFT